MRFMLLVLALAMSGCLPWGDAWDWADAPPGTTSWEWILDVDALPAIPPPVDRLGLDGLDVDEGYVGIVLDAGTQPWCYLSVGTAERFRADYGDFEAAHTTAVAAETEGVLGAELPDWPDERWLNVRRADLLLPLMEARLNICRDKGFTHVELDNMDGHTNDTGFDLTATDVRSWVASLVAAAADRDLGVIHKNAPDLVADLEPSTDALLLESCVLDGLCEQAAAPFLEAGKPVFNVEYPELWRAQGSRFRLDDVCAEAEASGANTLIKDLDLDARSIVCAAR